MEWTERSPDFVRGLRFIQGRPLYFFFKCRKRLHCFLSTRTHTDLVQRDGLQTLLVPGTMVINHYKLFASI